MFDEQECKPYTHHQDRPSDEDIFSNAFQTVLHTGTNYENLLQMEYTFQSEIGEMIKQRDKQIQELDIKFGHVLLTFLQTNQLISSFRHHREMQEVVSELTDRYPDVYVRNLAQKHMEDKQVETSIRRKIAAEIYSRRWKVIGIVRLHRRKIVRNNNLKIE